mgnify:CR=1 FL=1
MECLVIIVTTIINFLMLAFIKNFNNAYLTSGLILLNIIINIAILAKSNNKYKFHISFSYLLRSFFMFFDFFGREIFILPHSGSDTENFYNAGLLYMRSERIFNENFFGGIYSRFIGIILKAIGDNKLFIQYVNIILAILTIILLTRILEILLIDYKISKIMVMILCYFPNNIIISSLILRESWIIFLSTLGVLYYIKYMVSEINLYLIISILSIILSALFHSGMILLLIAILASEIYLNRNKNLIINALLIMVTLAMLYTFRDTVFRKFITQSEIVLSRDTYDSEAGSRYLSNIYVNSISDILKYGWLKAIYFIASPTVLYWRGMTDIISFLLDSTLYIFITLRIIFTRIKLSIQNKKIYLTLTLALVLLVFVFGLGTSTAGTAIRHRNKLIVIFIILLSMMENYKLKSINTDIGRKKMQNSEQNDMNNILNYIKINIPIIIVLTLIMGAAGYSTSKFLLTPKYESNATMIISNSTNVDSQRLQETNVDYNQIQANKALTSTYSEVVKSKGIADKVIKNLDLNMDYEEFSSKVSIEPVKDTQIISVKVVDTIPERSMDIANETANIFKESIGDIMKIDNVQILDGATLPEEPSFPSIKKNTVIGIFIGLVLGLFIAIFKELSDNTIKSQELVTEYFDLPVIGVVPDKKQG